MCSKKDKVLKKLITVLSFILAMCVSVAGTLTYLQVQKGPVVNTFAPSNIDLTLEETPIGEGTTTANTYKMIPGVEIAKDPKVTVSGDVDAYVFVKIDEAGLVTIGETKYTLDDFLTYAIAAGWTKHSETADTNGNETIVIYREVAANAAEADKTFSILVGDKVTTNASVTKQMMNAYTDSSIKLTFTAYAIQKAGFEGKIAEAWIAVQGQQG